MKFFITSGPDLIEFMRNNFILLRYPRAVALASVGMGPTIPTNQKIYNLLHDV